MPFPRIYVNTSKGRDIEWLDENKSASCKTELVFLKVGYIYVELETFTSRSNVWCEWFWNVTKWCSENIWLMKQIPKKFENKQYTTQEDKKTILYVNMKRIYSVWNTSIENYENETNT